jgi:hypothetical protein
MTPCTTLHVFTSLLIETTFSFYLFHITPREANNVSLRDFPVPQERSTRTTELGVVHPTASHAWPRTRHPTALVVGHRTQPGLPPHPQALPPSLYTGTQLSNKAWGGFYRSPERLLPVAPLGVLADRTTLDRF